MVSASSRLRKVVIGGSSSLMPLASISFRPVASSKRLKRAAFDLAADEQHIELAQRVARSRGFRDCPRAGTGPGRRSGAGRA